MQNTKSFRPLLVSLGAIVILGLVVWYIKLSGYSISYQVSISMPKGWYLIMPAKDIQKGSVVIFYPANDIKQFLISKHWVPDSGLLMKEVVAKNGDYVCKKNGAVFINGKKIAPVLKFYAPHKLLPSSQFCNYLAKNEYLMLSTKIKRSFDGRYFGPVKREQIIGIARFLF